MIFLVRLEIYVGSWPSGLYRFVSLLNYSHVMHTGVDGRPMFRRTYYDYVESDAPGYEGGW